MTKRVQAKRARIAKLSAWISKGKRRSAAARVAAIAWGR